MDITAAAGGGVHTLTPAIPSTTSVQIQGSNDASNWVNIGSSTNITVAGSVLVEDSDISYRHTRLAITAGTGLFTANIIASGQEIDVA